MVTYSSNKEFYRWYANALLTLKSAQVDESSGFFNWACFKAQQASEYVVKGYLGGTGNDIFGTSVSSLLKRSDSGDNVVNVAKKLIDTTFQPDTRMLGRRVSLGIIIQLRMLKKQYHTQN